MTKMIKFDQSQRAQIEQAAMEFYGLDEAGAKSYVENIEQTGYLEVYTGGSLINYSHLQNDDKTFKNYGEDKKNGVEGIPIETQFPGIKTDELFENVNVRLEGYNNDFVCYDIHYRGTPEEPGITIGMDKVDGATAHGTVMRTRISHLDPQVAADFACYYMERLKQREFPPNMPIYTLKPLEVKDKHGNVYNAVVCVADQNGPLYIHNRENRYAQKDQSYYIPRGEEGFDRVVEIMAVAGNPVNPDTGEAKDKGKITDFDYLKNAVQGFRKEGVQIPAKHMRLLTAIAKYRMDNGITFPKYEEMSASALQDFVKAASDYNAQFANPANDDQAPNTALEA